MKEVKTKEIYINDIYILKSFKVKHNSNCRVFFYAILVPKYNKEASSIELFFSASRNGYKEFSKKIKSSFTSIRRKNPDILNTVKRIILLDFVFKGYHDKIENRKMLKTSFDINLDKDVLQKVNSIDLYTIAGALNHTALDVKAILFKPYNNPL